NLANILRDLGEHAEARKQIELALESDLRQFGPDHPNVATRHNNLATILYFLGDFPGALREIDQALAIRRKTLPPAHPYIKASGSTREMILRALQAVR
ncbi:MAG: tetratricopeptide repeat protein, partial [Acidobacteria bacterium]|nr:tetratricopeptide repeat protein [Acidobacteriota bacterium]